MMVAKPQPGQWVLIAAKVLDDPHPTSEEVVVEMFSKTDQYAAREARTWREVCNLGEPTLVSEP
ncbi:hypothetical protein [Plantactinospora sp. WMMB782]|uniref:hypothetical protein n=1 Tax=Plantactinospora sp. WMMB782 TaxID=3404121 RepID=UPI003B932BEB